MCHCITLLSCTGVTGQIMSALLCNLFMHTSNIMQAIVDNRRIVNHDCKPFDIRVGMRSSHSWPSCVL